MILWYQPPLAGPSCAYVDVYAHLGDTLWYPYLGYPIWVSQMDEQHIKSAIAMIRRGRASTAAKAKLPYLLKELETRETRRAVLQRCPMDRAIARALHGRPTQSTSVTVEQRDVAP